MESYTFRLATAADKAAVVAFINRHWDTRHPLVNRPEWFRYYYKGEAGGLHFALAEKRGTLAAAAGYIPASQAEHPDIWVSIWVADPAAQGSGLELMAALPGLTGCRTLACNNIRPQTRPFYHFLGYTTGRVGHFYRLADRETYQVARVNRKERLPISGNAELRLLPDADALRASGFRPPAGHNPYKDLWYLARRYYAFPHQSYRVYGVMQPGVPEPQALLMLRVIPIPLAGGTAKATAVVRIADYVGDATLLPHVGTALDRLLQAENAEYIDFYCAGIDPALLRLAGFSERLENDDNILPNYLTPPLFENTDYYYFTSEPENFVLCKADGDQDRPNLSSAP